MNKIAFLALALLSILMSGCSTTSAIPPEKQKSFALLDAHAHFGAKVLSYIVMVDQETFHRGFSSEHDVLTGKHTVKVDACTQNEANLLQPFCNSKIYIFDAKAGFAYMFEGSYIQVFDRFDLKKPLYNLTLTENSVFVTPEESKQFSDAQQKLWEARKALENEAQVAAQSIVTEQRKRNLPVVKKIGARICQELGGGVINVGFVEGIAEEKVQIRISKAYFKNNPNASPGGFSQSIVWDSPMNWDLCE
jgi:hypothetical protein